MEKQQLLEELKQAVALGVLSPQEVTETVEITSPLHQDSLSKKMNLSQVMYYIGGAIVFLGICILIGQNWDYLSNAVKILVTLGSALAGLVVAILLFRYDNLKGVAQAFFLISALVMPLGFYVTLDKMSLDIALSGTSVMIWLVLTVVFSLLFWYYRLTSLLLYVIIFATGFFHYCLSWIMGANFIETDKIIQYRFLATGASYVLLGYYLSQTPRKVLTGFLYGFGIIGFLGAAMALGGWSPNQNVFWELVFPFLVFGTIFLSVALKSKSFLVFGTLFLVGYIFKLTGEYFQQSMGWPLALVIAGFLVMLIGYYAVKINKEYLTTIKLK